MASMIGLHCSYCGVRLRFNGAAPNRKGFGAAHTLDHVLPKSQGGTVVIPACIACNDAKGDRPVIEFLRSSWLRDRRSTVRNNDDNIKPDEWFEALLIAETMT